MKRKESGVLSEVEQRVEQLVMEEEAALELQLAELELEREQEGKLCVTPFGVDIVGISETIALAGALVGGLAAGKRKKEVDKLNDQLRKINMQLRQQARAGTMFAPGLTYAPVSSLAPGASGAVAVAPVRPPVVVKPTTTRTPSGTMVSVSMEEDEMSADQIACRDALKTGKGMLKEKNGPGAMVRFEKALMISKALGDKIQERRACRGLAAASRLNKQHATAIKYLERVLEVSREMQEYTGDADAFGTIADCYTDMGEFEKAAQFYDKYIAAMG
ncbi:hypothetical protein FOA52_010864 [Chlamydomonas sp. UWO 241]|nr:hypothetical protein FOA52_010864 [Chlamydomonas sp. UWO 241]